MQKDADKYFDMNNIYCMKDREHVQWYIPVYLRIKIKQVLSINLQTLNAKISATLNLSIFYGELDIDQPQLFEKLQNQVVLSFGQDQPLILNTESPVVASFMNQQLKLITFIIRKNFDLRITSEVFLSPFQTLNLIFSINIQALTGSKDENYISKIKIKEQMLHRGCLKSRYTVNFNLMDYTSKKLKLFDRKIDEQIKCQYEQQISYGPYDMAQANVRVIYSNSSDPLEKVLIPKQQQIYEYHTKFQHAHFIFAFYRYPTTAIATIFLPLWILGLFNLTVFFQTNNIDTRMASLAAIMIAFVALIPTIRRQVPLNSQIILIQVLVYFELLSCLLCLLQSFLIRQINPQEYQFIWQDDPIFIIALLVFLINVIIIFGLFLWHKLYRQKYLNLPVQKHKKITLLPSQWKNIKCDKIFTIYGLKRAEELKKDIKDIYQLKYHNIKQENITSNSSFHRFVSMEINYNRIKSQERMRSASIMSEESLQHPLLQSQNY